MGRKKKEPKELEDHGPGADRETVIDALQRVVQPTKEPTPRSKKREQSREPAS